MFAQLIKLNMMDSGFIWRGVRTKPRQVYKATNRSLLQSSVGWHRVFERRNLANVHRLFHSGGSVSFFPHYKRQYVQIIVLEFSLELLTPNTGRNATYNSPVLPWRFLRKMAANCCSYKAPQGPLLLTMKQCLHQRPLRQCRFTSVCVCVCVRMSE